MTPQGYVQTKIGLFPESWNIVPLEKLATVKDGTHLTPCYTSSGVPFLRVTDIGNSEISLDSVKFISQGEHQQLIKRCYPRKGDILYSKNGTVGIPRIVDWDWEFSIFVSLALLRIRDHNQLDTRFFYHYLFSDLAKREIYQGSKQGTVTNLHLEEIRKFRVPLPPLPEQRAIASILSTWDEAITLTKRLIAALQTRKRGLMQRLLTGEVRFPEFEGEWEEYRIEQIAAKRKHAIVDGPFGSNLKSEHYQSSGIPVIQSGYVTSGKFIADDYVYVNERLFQQQIRSKVVAGDIVMAKIGVRAGSCAILPEGHPISILAGNCLKISTDPHLCQSQYLLELLKYTYETTAFVTIKTETAQPAINLENLKHLKIKLPPIDEQTKISEVLQAHTIAIENFESCCSLFKHQKKGLMQRLLTGEIRVQVDE